MYSFSEKSQAYQQRLQAFMEQHIYPSETRHAQELHEASNRFATLPLTEALVPPGGGPDQVHQMALGKQLIGLYGEE